LIEDKARRKMLEATHSERKRGAIWQTRSGGPLTVKPEREEEIVDKASTSLKYDQGGQNDKAKAEAQALLQVSV
jgi:hypothetical protein